MPSKQDWKHIEKWALRRYRREVTTIEPVRERVAAAVLPLYSHVEITRPPELVGSGVLLRIGMDHFVMTAAHVIEFFNREAIVTGAGSRLVGLNGESYRSRLPASGSHQQDPIDVAVLHIQGAFPDELLGRALTVNDLGFDEPLSPLPCMLLGRTRKLTRVLQREVVSPSLTFVGGQLNERKYRECKLDPKEYVLLEWSSKRVLTTHGVGNAMSLRGASGGAILRLRENGDGSVAGRLIAIFIEKRERLGALVGARIGYHLGLIVQNHPHHEEAIRRAYNGS